jgi:hypothetical protein
MEKITKLTMKKFIPLVTLSSFLFTTPILGKESCKMESKKNIECLIEMNPVERNKDESRKSVSLNTFYFFSKAKRLDNGIYLEVSYESKIYERFSLQVATGYMKLKATDVNDSRVKKLSVIPIHLGPKYKLFRPLSIKGGLSYYKYHLDKVKVPSEFGGYVGIEISSNKKRNPNFFFEVRQQFGDLDIDYPLLEDETNIIGTLVGWGI